MPNTAESKVINLAPSPEDTCMADGCQSRAKASIRLPLSDGTSVVIRICRKCRPLFTSAVDYP